MISPSGKIVDEFLLLRNTAEPPSQLSNAAWECQHFNASHCEPADVISSWRAAVPQGIEGINGLAEIWALQVHLKHPDVNTIATESGIFRRQIESDTMQTGSPNLYLYGKHIQKARVTGTERFKFLLPSAFCALTPIKCTTHLVNYFLKVTAAFPPTYFKTFWFW